MQQTPRVLYTKLFARLMDAVDPVQIDQIEHVLSHSEGVRRVDSVKVRWIGHELHAEIEIAVDPAPNIADADADADAHAGVGAADGSVALA